jgi:hypothetical protein
MNGNLCGVSTGCGMAFISWLLSHGHGLDSIAQAMVALTETGTLAQLYAQLTGDVATNALPAFSAAVRGLAGGVTSDDPFGGASAAHQILASMRAALAGGPAVAPASTVATRCSTKSRRLLPVGR